MTFLRKIKIIIIAIILLITSCNDNNIYKEKATNLTSAQSDKSNDYLIWAYPTHMNFENPPSIPVVTALDYKNKVLYTSYFKGILTAIDTISGKTIWSYNFPTAEYPADIVQLGVHPTGDIYAMDLSNFTVWIISSQGKLKYAIPFDSKIIYIKLVPKFIFTSKGTCYYGAPDGKVYCVNGKGQIVWSTFTGESDNIHSLAPVVGLTLTKDEKTVVAVSSFNTHNPVCGINAETGKIEWQYRHPIYTSTTFLTTDELDNVILIANNPDILNDWFSIDPSATLPPYENLKRTTGGAVIFLDRNGNFIDVIELTNQFGLNHVTPDAANKRLYITGFTYKVEKDGDLVNLTALFATDYNGNLLWDTVDPIIRIVGHTNTDYIFLDGEYVYTGSDDGVKKFTFDGDLVETYKIYARRGSRSIHHGDYNEKVLYVVGVGEEISDRYGRLQRIYKVSIE